MGDIDRFPQRAISAGAEPFAFHSATVGRYGPVFVPLILRTDQSSDTVGFDRFLEDTDTYSFLVARRDTLIYERYFHGRTGESTETTFSVSKSLVSLGVGLAIDRGMIDNVHVPITTFLPELGERDPRFGGVTLHHLLTMRSGIRFERSKMPWGDEARSYYDPDLRRVAVTRDLAHDPGTEFQYNFYSPIVAGLALERATGMSLSQLLEDGVWRRIGSEAPASWSLDSSRNGFEKMESGFNARPRDLLRLGRLYLKKGEWEGERVVSREWVEASVRDGSPSVEPQNYGYFWWLDSPDGGVPAFYAEGRFGQFVYVVPDLELVMVRTGADDGDISWRSVFRRVAQRVDSVTAR